MFITGLSGNGKTMGVTQAMKKLIGVNITIETDEDDLLGGYRFKDGANGMAKWSCYRGDGKRLTLLLLDEVDLILIRLCVYNDGRTWCLC